MPPTCVFAFQPVVLQCAYCTSVIITDALVVHTIEITVVDEGGNDLPKPVIYISINILGGSYCSL